MSANADRYTHGHHESVLRSHVWRTAENSARFLIPHLRPGQALLDVGCGPGTISADLATLVAPGLVRAIDLAPEIIEIARSRVEHVVHANLTFDVDDVYALRDGDASYDVVFAHQVLQHLGDPVAALREMRRVLRPGGTLAVRDADFATFAWWPEDPRLTRWLALYHAVTKANGAEADAGRHLASWVKSAGFQGIVVSSSTWTFATREERAWWGGLWADRVVASSFARHALEHDLSNEEELAGIAVAFRDWAERDAGVFFVTHGEVVATP